MRPAARGALLGSINAVVIMLPLALAIPDEATGERLAVGPFTGTLQVVAVLTLAGILTGALFGALLGAMSHHHRSSPFARFVVLGMFGLLGLALATYAAILAWPGRDAQFLTQYAKLASVPTLITAAMLELWTRPASQLDPERRRRAMVGIWLGFALSAAVVIGFAAALAIASALDRLPRSMSRESPLLLFGAFTTLVISPALCVGALLGRLAVATGSSAPWLRLTMLGVPAISAVVLLGSAVRLDVLIAPAGATALLGLFVLERRTRIPAEAPVPAATVWRTRAR